MKNKQDSTNIYVAGDLQKELQELQIVQEEKRDGLYTITVGCSGLLTIICC